MRHLDLRLDAEVREYARGVHDAIAWVSGRSDVQP